MNQETAKKQNLKVTIFACLLSIISIGLLVFGFYIVSSDKVVMLQSISNLSNKFSEVIDTSSYLVDKISSSNNIGIKSNVEFSYNEENVSLSLDYLENNSLEKSKLDLSIDSNDTNLLDLDAYLADKNIYFYLNEITPNYYYTTLEYYSVLRSLSSNDYDKLTTLLKETITDYIDNENIEKEKVIISLNNKDKKVNKITYEIDNNTIKNIISSFFNSIQTDKALYQNIAAVLDITTKELDSICNDILNEIDKDNKILYKYSVYYYGFNQIVAYELEDVKNNYLIQYKIDNNDNIYLYSGEELIFSLKVTNNKNEYTFSGTLKNNDLEYDFSGNYKNNIITISLDDLDYKLEIAINKQEKDNEYIYKIGINALENDTNIFSLNITIEYYFNKIIDVDLKDSVNINDITEEDINTILNNLNENTIYQLILPYLEGYLI